MSFFMFSPPRFKSPAYYGSRFTLEVDWLAARLLARIFSVISRKRSSMLVARRAEVSRKGAPSSWAEWEMRY